MRMREFGVMRSLDIVTATLLIIGGINWGLLGVFGVDVIASLFGSMSIPSRIIYAIVGLSAVYEISMLKAIPRRWGCSIFGGAVEGAKS